MEDFIKQHRKDIAKSIQGCYSNVGDIQKGNISDEKPVTTQVKVEVPSPDEDVAKSERKNDFYVPDGSIHTRDVAGQIFRSFIDAHNAKRTV